MATEEQKEAAVGSNYPLLEQYPGVQEGLPCAGLGEFPTPVQRLNALEKELGASLGEGRLYVKRDDLSSSIYGGNKVRNLDFLLGRALRDRKREVLTFGGAGSNQGVATAIYAKHVGMRSISMLIPQPNAQIVRANLLMSHLSGAELHHSSGMAVTVFSTLYQLARHAVAKGAFPQLIPPGGTSALGMVGFVNAAFELKQQVEAGEMPEPDLLCAPLGTMGTVIGLLLGLQACGMKTRVMAVRVTDPQWTSMRKARRLFKGVNEVLHGADPSFPLVPFPEERFGIRHDYFGEEYGLYTDQSVAAARRVRETDGPALEPTYTGKAFAALLGDAEAGQLKDQVILFWDTANSRPFPKELDSVDYHELPKAFHRYFEEDVQPLDKVFCP